MGEKPSYLGLLNAIANAELGGEQLFTAWAGATGDDAVRDVLQTIALREAEHARSFAKRIDELGFRVRAQDDPKLPARVAMAKSKKLSDREKFEKLGFATTRSGPDIFTRFFDDMSIDIQTGELLGRYLSEERDTGRRLRACYVSVAGDTAITEPVAAATHPNDPKSSKDGKRAKHAKDGKRAKRAKGSKHAKASKGDKHARFAK